MGRVRNMIEDAKKLLGLPPYNVDTNTSKHDGMFAEDCARFWGGDAFSEVCQRLQQEFSLEK